jgi:hypothetical protein
VSDLSALTRRKAGHVRNRKIRTPIKASRRIYDRHAAGQRAEGDVDDAPALVCEKSQRHKYDEANSGA